MSDDRLYEVRAGYEAYAYLADEPPDLGPMRALAAREELAEAASGTCRWLRPSAVRR